MKGKCFTSLLFLILVSTAAFAQSAKLKRANAAYDDLNYMEAIELYTQILDKNDISEAKIKLADCYRKISNSAEAEYWYGQVVRLPEAEPTHYLFYGMMLHTNGKCELAQEWFDKYISAVPDDLRGQYLSRSCTYEEELMTKNAGIYEIKNLPFNTAMDDFSPMYYKDGLIITSEFQKVGPVSREHSWTGDPFTELFYVPRNVVDEEVYDYEYGKPESFSNRINSKYHDATPFFTNDESTIYFTRNNLFKGKTGRDDERTIRLKIYSADSNDGTSWTNIIGMPFNSDEYSVAHPTLTPDGMKMFFASDMPGGFGGMDLYMSEDENGRWGPPINLGPSINTEGNEIFPYYSRDGKLYFASDGHIGLGGLDICYIEDKKGEWGPITNVGYPINSRSDDFGLIFNEDNKHGYFTSDREGGAGDDDIYSFIKLAAPVEIYVYDELTKQPIAGATVMNDCTGGKLTTDEKGIATLEMKLEQCCGFEASQEDYLDNKKQGCTKNLQDGEKVFVEIPLSKEEEVVEPEDVAETNPEDISDPNAKGVAQFDLIGTVFDKLTGSPVEGATVTLTNDCGDDEMTMLTDASGKYKFMLKPNCCYTVKSTKIGFLSGTVSGQCTKELDASTTLQADIYLQKYLKEASDPNIVVNETGAYPGNTVDETGVSKEYSGSSYTPEVSYSYDNTAGAITFLLHIYYDFDQSYIRDDAESELEKLYQLMVDNPELVVEIGSHTDSRGSNSYNDRLSQRRAEAVVRWLRAKGISKTRLKPKGYGETINVNNCSNNVPCSEEEHQWNRRTEFKVVGYYNTEGQYKEIDSQRPGNVNVDPCQGCPF